VDQEISNGQGQHHENEANEQATASQDSQDVTPNIRDTSAMQTNIPWTRREQAPVKRGWGARLLKYMAIALFVCVLIVAGVFVRIAISPMSISSVVDRIEDAASQTLAPGQILELEDAQVSLAEGGGLALRLTNVRLTEGAQSLFSAQRIDLEIDFLSLLKRKFIPSQIYVPQLEAHLVRDELGRFIIEGK
jgi:hypothetical protein